MRSRFLSPSHGFTLIELLVVVAIIGILATVIVVAINPTMRFQEIYLSQSKEQLATLARATDTYLINNGGVYPADVDRGLPGGIMNELKGTHWPKAPWPNSLYDWDNIEEHGYVQLSIRFCDINGNNCLFPLFDWAENFDNHSAVYYCISGPCRSHRTMPIDHPGYCVNCNHED